MAQFKGINQSGQDFTFDAADSAGALTNPNLSANSGVQAITSDTLKGGQDLPLPQAQTPVAGDAVQGVLESTSLRLKTAEENKEEEKSSLQSSFDELLGVTESKGQLEEDAGIPGFAQELDQITNEIEGKQLALRRQIERIQAEPGLTKGQVNQRVQVIERKGNMELADLAIIQNAANRNLLTAQNLVDKKIELALEPLKLQLDFQQQFYKEASDAFTQAERDEYTEIINANERAYNEQRESLKTLETTKLSVLQQAVENGAPAGVLRAIQGAETTNDVITAGGKYGTDMLGRQAQLLQIENMRSQINVRNTESGQNSGKPLTSSQYQALGFGERMLTSGTIIDEVGVQFTSAFSRFSSFTPQGLKSDDRQKFDQAKRNFINAVLRRESGAAISPEEFDNATLQYFPQPGDGEQVLIQKKQNRDAVTQGFLREAGVDTTPQSNSLSDPLGLGITPQVVDPLGLNN